MGAGNFPRLLNRLAFVFKPEGAAMTNSKLKAITFEKVLEARNLPAQAVSRPLERNSAASGNNSLGRFYKDFKKLNGFISDAFKVLTKFLPDFFCRSFHLTATRAYKEEKPTGARIPFLRAHRQPAPAEACQH